MREKPSGISAGSLLMTTSSSLMHTYTPIHTHTHAHTHARIHAHALTEQHSVNVAEGGVSNTVTNANNEAGSAEIVAKKANRAVTLTTLLRARRDKPWPKSAASNQQPTTTYGYTGRTGAALRIKVELTL